MQPIYPATCTLLTFCDISVIDELTDKIGRLLATLHDEGIIHGDLTTSNLILRNDNRSVVCILSRYRNLITFTDANCTGSNRFWVDIHVEFARR